ncbi:MAG TPA: hypothetical protein VGK41_05510 [Solirubrobacterales bacterium]
MTPLELGLHDVPLEQLHESPINPRSITDEAFERLKANIVAARDMLQARPLIAMPDGEVICGNMRLRALKDFAAHSEVDESTATAPTFVADLDENERREWMLRDNNEFGDWEQDALAELMAAHKSAGGDMALLGFAQPEVDDLLAHAAGGAGGGGGSSTSGPSLADRFTVPPFTVIDGRAYDWRERKRSWLELGIKSEVGREGVTGSISKGDPSAGDPQFYDKKAAKEAELGRELGNQEFIREHYTDPRGGDGTSLAKNSVSVFDPMLCELIYRWYSGTGQLVLDPFAGGSVRGVVAGKLKRRYVGADLSVDQVLANCEQADAIMGPDDFAPVWVHGDSRYLEDLEPDGDRKVGDTEYDLLFTCPPYFNLEVYSDDDRDLSRAASWEDFLSGYERCLLAGVELLHDDRFAVVVVGDVRDKAGRMLPLTAETIRIMRSTGLSLYDHAIFVTPVGSLRIRAARYFVESRKLGRTHQSVLVFVKGDGKRAAEAAGEVDRTAIQEAVDAATGDEEEEAPETD